MLHCSSYRNKALCYARNGINDLLPRADMCGATANVCFGPMADIALATPFTIKRPPTEAASHGVLRNRLLLDLDDEAGRGLLRLFALSIEGLPGGRLEER